mgnify:CR=1 FL=1
MMALNVFLDPGVSPLLTRDVENSQQVLRVQGMLKINEVVPHRRLLHEDSHLHKVSERRHRLKPVQVFTFTDMVAVYRPERRQPSMLYPFSVATFSDLPEDAALPDRFPLLMRGGHKMDCILSFSSPEERSLWLERTRDALAAFQQRSQQRS